VSSALILAWVLSVVWLGFQWRYMKLKHEGLITRKTSVKYLIGDAAFVVVVILILLPMTMAG
jgi:hypothetical protein